MSVERTNQIWFPWERCRDGYEIHTDKGGALWIQPVSANSEKIMPLNNAALFRQFADLDKDNPKAILDFVSDSGLDDRGLEPDPVGKWMIEIGKMHDAVLAWHQKDFDGLAVRFNKLNMGGSVHLRLESQPRNKPPILYIEPRGLFLALWAQLAHAVSNNEVQRQCNYCRDWYRPQTKRSLFCSGNCRAASNYHAKKEQR